LDVVDASGNSFQLTGVLTHEYYSTFYLDMNTSTVLPPGEAFEEMREAIIDRRVNVPDLMRKVLDNGGRIL
jgi:hypothetical protein